jgi:sterol desaturase/sphingolipid hydroxylase (fatty acid hydroxylase superfamily)
MLSLLSGFLDWLRAITPIEIKEYYWAAQYIYLDPRFWGFTVAILVWEWFQPARPEQGVLSRGLVQDFVWFNTDAVFKVAALPAVAGGFQMLYGAVAGEYRFSFLPGWPMAARIVLAILAFDFLQWFHHWVRHKVRAFWHFHAIHHSQRELNVFTDLRVHGVEYVISEGLVFVPMIALGMTPYAVMGVGALRWWYTRLIHANIRNNFGPLKHVLVTPQFHRIHHSIEPQHWDRNFGVVFSLWDRMAGTLYRGYDEYPATGVADVHFDPPASASPWAWAKDYLRQIWYPFRKLLGRDF